MDPIDIRITNQAGVLEEWEQAKHIGETFAKVRGKYGAFMQTERSYWHCTGINCRRLCNSYDWMEVELLHFSITGITGCFDPEKAAGIRFVDRT
jgi:hypothetical protein